MSEIINLINIDNNISKNSIIELTKFIDVSIDKINKSITTPKIPQNLHPIIINIDTFFNIYIYKY